MSSFCFWESFWDILLELNILLYWTLDLWLYFIRKSIGLRNICAVSQAYTYNVQFIKLLRFPGFAALCVGINRKLQLYMLTQRGCSEVLGHGETAIVEDPLFGIDVYCRTRWNVRLSSFIFSSFYNLWEKKDIHYRYSNFKDINSA